MAPKRVGLCFDLDKELLNFHEPAGIQMEILWNKNRQKGQLDETRNSQ